MAGNALPTKATMNDDFEAWSDCVNVLDGLKTARQIAYVNAKRRPGLMPTYGDINGIYRGFCNMIGVPYEEPFDSEAHAAKRRAEGHPHFS